VGDLLLHTFGPGCFFAGPEAGNRGLTGVYNTGLGLQALVNLTSGEDNTATGAGALLSSTEGNANTATGASALLANPLGNANTAAGYSALSANTTGGGNTAVWSLALFGDAFPDRGFGDRRQVGFIAQEVEPVLPEVVTKGADGYYSVAYSGVVPVLVEAAKELHAQMRAKDAEIAGLRARLDRLEQALTP
jgi:hypothetical protein